LWRPDMFRSLSSMKPSLKRLSIERLSSAQVASSQVRLAWVITQGKEDIQ
jgi:hypothetical protein